MDRHVVLGELAFTKAARIAGMKLSPSETASRIALALTFPTPGQPGQLSSGPDEDLVRELAPRIGGD